MLPRGGTELQHEFLNKHADPKLLDQVQITTSVPEKIPLHPTKLNILWQKNSYDQPNLAPWFKDKSNHSKYDWYVFNSHWNYEKFRMAFDVPSEKCHVIKNGCTSFPKRKPYKKGDPIKLIFHPTPWRGLNVILLAMQMVKNPLIKLDVYSSTQVYGDAFREAHDHAYVELYKQASQLPNVNYIGYKPNEYILENMQNYHIFAYPSIWEETFCISALEAMSAGLYCVTTNFGALFETCSEFPIYVTYTKDHVHLAKCFAQAIEIAADSLHEPYIQDHLSLQQDFCQRFYNWQKKGNEWNNFLKGALSVRSNQTPVA
jgi:glycosyltransferase involved in cell wall biosynthesis